MERLELIAQRRIDKAMLRYNVEPAEPRRLDSDTQGAAIASATKILHQQRGWLQRCGQGVRNARLSCRSSRRAATAHDGRCRPHAGTNHRPMTHRRSPNCGGK